MCVTCRRARLGSAYIEDLLACRNTEPGTNGADSSRASTNRWKWRACLISVRNGFSGLSRGVLTLNGRYSDLPQSLPLDQSDPPALRQP